MALLSRQDVASKAGITLRQLDHFATAGVAAPDVGNERKRFSITEGRLAVIAGRCLVYGMTPRALAAPIGVLRKYAQWPTIENLPVGLSDIEAVLNKRRAENKKSSRQWTQLENAMNFEFACRGERDLFFHIAPGWKSSETFISTVNSRVEKEATWLVVDIRALFRERDVRTI